MDKSYKLGVVLGVSSLLAAGGIFYLALNKPITASDGIKEMYKPDNIEHYASSLELSSEDERIPNKILEGIVRETYPQATDDLEGFSFTLHDQEYGYAVVVAVSDGSPDPGVEMMRRSIKPGVKVKVSVGNRRINQIYPITVDNIQSVEQIGL